ncbi:MAG TPA: hypothetical protein VNT58_12560 [Gaiellaceae bacterium]|nr:hypothetical protein [Gaiellaceae bacterium]
MARGVTTLIGAAVAGFLIWLSAQFGTDAAGDYWLTYGLVAAAGLTMALSQLLGGWTKWGWPRLSLGVFLLGFLPVLVAGGWVLLARQPADFFNTSNWSRDLGIMGVVGDLGEFLAAIAFLVGLTFGFTFDTAGPRREVVVERDHDVVARDSRPAGRTAADEPLAAERHRDADGDSDEDYREPDPSFRETIVGDRRNEPRA